MNRRARAPVCRARAAALLLRPFTMDHAALAYSEARMLQWRVVPLVAVTLRTPKAAARAKRARAA